MKNLFLLLRWAIAAVALLLSSLPIQAQAPTFDRAVACAGSPDFPAGPRQVAIDVQGNTIAAGVFNGTVLIGNTLLTAAGAASSPGLIAPSDVFVAKLDAAGAYMWAVKVGGTLNEETAGVAVDAAGDVYVTGYFDSYSMSFGPGITLYNSSAAREMYVAKLSGATGQCLWARRAGGTGSEIPAGISVDASGEVYVAGYSGSGSADFGQVTLTTSQYGYVFIAKLSSAGAWQWVQQTGTGGFPSLSGMVLDRQGSIYVAGTFIDGSSAGRSRSVSFGATTLTTYTPGTPSRFPSSEGKDLFIAKFTGMGTPLWAVQGASGGQNMITSCVLAADGQGHLYVAGGYGWQSVRLGTAVLPNLSPATRAPQAPIGQYSYEDNAYLARLTTATGAWEWTMGAGGTPGDNIQALTTDAQGRVYVAGNYDYGLANPLPGGGQVSLAQLDGATRTWLWARPQEPKVVTQSLALDGAGHLWRAGWFNGLTATFGPVTLAHTGGAGGSTGYLARLGSGPLATQPAGLRAVALQVWPNPSGAGPVWVQGPGAGQPVQVLDALGRAVAGGRMPAAGPLALPLPAALPAGLYLVRSTGQVQRLVIE